VGATINFSLGSRMRNHYNLSERCKALPRTPVTRMRKYWDSPGNEVGSVLTLDSAVPDITSKPGVSNLFRPVETWTSLECRLLTQFRIMILCNRTISTKRWHREVSGSNIDHPELGSSRFFSVPLGQTTTHSSPVISHFIIVIIF
jgi:hypothetical protein